MNLKVMNPVLGTRKLSGHAFITCTILFYVYIGSKTKFSLRITTVYESRSSAIATTASPVYRSRGRTTLTAPSKWAWIWSTLSQASSRRPTSNSTWESGSIQDAYCAACSDFESGNMTFGAMTSRWLITWKRVENQGEFFGFVMSKM